jgi:hypothetical protein
MRGRRVTQEIKSEIKRLMDLTSLARSVTDLGFKGLKKRF